MVLPGLGQKQSVWVELFQVDLLQSYSYLSSHKYIQQGLELFLGLLAQTHW